MQVKKEINKKSMSYKHFMHMQLYTASEVGYFSNVSMEQHQEFFFLIVTLFIKCQYNLVELFCIKYAAVMLAPITLFLSLVCADCFHVSF